MAKKKAKKTTNPQPVVLPKQVQISAPVQETGTDLFDLSDPDEFRKAFIAAEILNRKY